MVPSDLRYTREHEWIRVEGGVATVGITDYAAHQLGDIVFVELPTAGSAVTAGKALGVVESVKAVSDLFAPVSGSVRETNDELGARPELANTDPFGDGWMVRIDVSDAGELEGLLDAAAYEALVAEG